MGVFDWIKQTAQKAWDWTKQTAGKAAEFVKKVPEYVNTGAAWLNKNVIQPGADLLKDVPIIGEKAALIKRGGQALENLTGMAAGKQPFSLKAALGGVQDVAAGAPAAVDVAKEAIGNPETRKRIFETVGQGDLVDKIRRRVM